jgi:hypothetical protein
MEVRLTMERNRKKTLPLTETLVFDIVEFLLDNGGYGFSNEISYYIVDNKPRRYTSREVVGILRNRPMFKHANTNERKGGIKWRLDLLALNKYIVQKGYQERYENMELDEKVVGLKEYYLETTLNHLTQMTDKGLDETYQDIASLWC